MNRRNIRYIGRYNSRKLYPLVDDKLQTKLLAREHGITTPALIGTVSTQFEVKSVTRQLEGHPGFVIKPAKGSGGKGILVIEHIDGSAYIKPSGAHLGREDIERHVSNILSGLYSLGGSPDVAVIEALINFDETLTEYTYEGVPDIRVIVFQGYPVMAMMRLSTAASDGKANLHQAPSGSGSTSLPVRQFVVCSLTGPGTITRIPATSWQVSASLVGRHCWSWRQAAMR